MISDTEDKTDETWEKKINKNTANAMERMMKRLCQSSQETEQNLFECWLKHPYLLHSPSCLTMTNSRGDIERHCQFYNQVQGAKQIESPVVT